MKAAKKDASLSYKMDLESYQELKQKLRITSAKGLWEGHAGCQAGVALFQAVQLDAGLTICAWDAPRMRLPPC